MATADALLLLVGDHAKSDAETTSKVYEYMASERPIITFCPRGTASVDRILAEWPAYRVGSDSPGQLAAVLEQLMDNRSTSGDDAARAVILGRYSRVQVAKELARWLDCISSR